MALNGTKGIKTKACNVTIRERKTGRDIMSDINLSRRHNINEKVEEFRRLKNCYLIDVRERNEFIEKRIPGAINVPLSTPELINEVVPKKTALLYVYCQSGARSRGAAKKFKKMGYQRVQHIGGIRAYMGETESGEE